MFYEIEILKDNLLIQVYTSYGKYIHTIVSGTEVIV